MFCPNCAARLVGADSEAPWCPWCEWNLAAVPATGRGRKARAASRQQEAAFAMDRRLFNALDGAAPTGRPGVSGALVIVTGASVLLGVAAVLLLLLALALILTTSWPGKLLGLALIGCVVGLRPRLPGIGIAPGSKSRSEAPALFALVDAVAAQIGSPTVDLVVVDEAFGASCARYGLRRRRVLVLGLPLWSSLGPAGRIALLAHQLAHLVDGDPDQRLFTQIALSTFDNLAGAFAPRGSRPQPVHEYRQDRETRAGEYLTMIELASPVAPPFESISGGLSAVVCQPMLWACTSAHRALRALTAEGRHRAEYYADLLALQAAGSAGALEYCQTLMLHEAVFTSTSRWLRAGAEPGTIRREAALVRDNLAGDMRQHEQRSIRADSSLFAAHPPLGWRLRLLRSWPAAAGRMSFAELDLDAVDTQLHPDYRRVARAMIHVS